MKTVKVGMVGDENSCLPFSSLGITTFNIEEDSLKSLENKLIEDGYKLLMVTEDIYEKHEDDAELFRKKGISVLVIPSSKERKKLAYSRIKKIVEKAVGTDILERKE
ncbi:MAG: hypothetical protein KAS39_06710 [Actinomycetia bacterium]|nr:hypothetical protein [Actinomycetes bacterium]